MRTAMPPDQRVIADFRRRLREAVENNREAWAASRRLVAPSAAAETLQRLRAAVAGSSLDPDIRRALLQVLGPSHPDGLQAIPHEGLRELTGLNPTKAVRNLCLLLGVGAGAVEAGHVSSMAQDQVEAAVRSHDNPFDVLLEADVASVVDCGAGDLTVAEKVVVHGGEKLTFPPWKFDVYGPLALLDLLSRKGKLCILSAVDMETFWEILSQLLPDDAARPAGVFFTESNVRQVFGEVYDQLLRLSIGQKMLLPKVRQGIPRVLGDAGKRGDTYGFRYVEIRRGAHFPGVPAGRTAYLFDQMKLEAAPWFLTLVPAS